MTIDQLLAELEAKLAARKERKMGDDKMREEFEEWYGGRREGKAMTDYKLMPEYPSFDESANFDPVPYVQSISAPVEALTTDLTARINKVSKRSLDGNVIMSSEEWNGIVQLVEKLITPTYRKGKEI